MKKIHTLLFILFPLLLSGQTYSPGGTEGVCLWLRTAPKTRNMQGKYYWQDFSGDSAKARLYDARGASFGKEFQADRSHVRTFNFNPSLNISENNRTKEVLIKYSNLSQATIMGTFSPAQNFSSDAFVYGLNGRPGDGIILSKDKLVHAISSNKLPLDYGNGTGLDLQYSQDGSDTESQFREKSLRISSYCVANQPIHSVWGEKKQAVITLGKTYASTNVNFTSEFNQNVFGNNEMQGYCPELIVYNRILDPMERRKAETYLAIKYGITLGMSYIGSNNQLLWDINAAKNYKYRITGIIRDDASNLYQPTSTTSYEEAPYFSTSYDSFDRNNSYNLPSRYRLLVIGRAYANRIANHKYLIWGDNGEGLQTSESAVFKDLHLMSRKWLARTNLDSLASYGNLWDWTNLSIKEHDFKYFVKPSLFHQNENLYHNSTTIPLSGKNGYFSWIYTHAGIDITLKLGTAQRDIQSGDYGYHIDAQGYVYNIENGIQQTEALMRINTGEKIEINKTEDGMYLRIDNERSKPWRDVIIREKDKENAFYGNLIISGANASSIEINKLLIGGFFDTGNRVELSYGIPTNSSFNDYRNGRSYLIIDRSGRGDFTSEELLFIPNDEWDEKRGKIIFNNVFWDTDKNGKDLFTFGYLATPLLAKTTPEQPSCNNGVSKKDGGVKIDVMIGTPCYKYELYNKGTHPNTLISSDYFGANTHSIDSLSAGDYSLHIKQLDGMTVKAAEYGSKVGSSKVTQTGEVRWRVGEENQFYMIGFEEKKEPLMLNSSRMRVLPFKNGLFYENKGLFLIDNRQILSYTKVPVDSGDEIRVACNGSRFSYYINDMFIYSSSMNPTFQEFKIMFYMDSGSALHNASFSGFPANNKWVDYHQSAQLIANTSIEKVYDFTLDGSCRSGGIVPRSQEAVTVNSADASALEVSREHRTNNFKAETILSTPGQATLVVFDVTGKMILRKEMDGTENIKTAHFSILRSGVYIVKALTNSGEFTQKIVINPKP